MSALGSATGENRFSRTEGKTVQQLSAVLGINDFIFIQEPQPASTLYRQNHMLIVGSFDEKYSLACHDLDFVSAVRFDRATRYEAVPPGVVSE
jgi:hypothetical protein